MESSGESETKSGVLLGLVRLPGASQLWLNKVNIGGGALTLILHNIVTLSS